MRELAAGTGGAREARRTSGICHCITGPSYDVSSPLLHPIHWHPYSLVHTLLMLPFWVLVLRLWRWSALRAR
jgi:hypothetical protein